ncbi:FAD-binding domain-containing protein [Tepidicella baoligensis]|uniref:FAD-binding domain-containing protein n=1 Tax=Tepidicella baoligensis TaxID=2707016 RepID=UPI0015D9B38B|nr:FAD-binding domain-containing protein [Tepidicella baoligensis]
MGYRVVWFKRDLRLADHEALASAARHGPVLCLYVVEPSLWAQPDAATQHYHFIRESLADLQRALRRLGGQLWTVVGEVVDILERLHRQAPFDALHSHEETGNAHTYARDLAVGRWCRQQGVAWHETPCSGVVRRLRQRDGWHKLWEARMTAPQAECPPLRFFPPPWPAEPLPTPEALGLDPWDPPRRQRGGRSRAMDTLQDFLELRCADYRGGISSPLTAPSTCSRLSAYLAYGCLSLREVVQATRATLAALPPQARRSRQGLQAFHSRLYWHCHFIQKLESEPELEWRNVHRGYDGLREHEWRAERFEALQAGRTGWPMVDACVAMLRETGWLNFRMRAMLVSVAAYPLWLHWREVGHWLARQFLDYEPGIHWSQMQMQSGTTGINTTRVYNPIKQARDHDPHGQFVRQWLPAMQRVPDGWLFEPWRMPPDLKSRLGVDWPQPLVDLEVATRDAKRRIHALRTQPAVRQARASIVERHGSRRGLQKAAARTAAGNEAAAPHRAPPPSTGQQLTLDF